MKKNSFLSGVNAKLALATVALTSVMFTSCEKEEFNVAPVELEPASATEMCIRDSHMVSIIIKVCFYKEIGQSCCF